jgi:hypothetical protein
LRAESEDLPRILPQTREDGNMRTGRRKIAATAAVALTAVWTGQVYGLIDDVCVYNRTVKP